MFHKYILFLTEMLRFVCSALLLLASCIDADDYDDGKNSLTFGDGSLGLGPALVGAGATAYGRGGSIGTVPFSGFQSTRFTSVPSFAGYPGYRFPNVYGTYNYRFPGLTPFGGNTFGLQSFGSVTAYGGIPGYPGYYRSYPFGSTSFGGISRSFPYGNAVFRGLATGPAVGNIPQPGINFGIRTAGVHSNFRKVRKVFNMRR